MFCTAMNKISCLQRLTFQDKFLFILINHENAKRKQGKQKNNSRYIAN